MTFFKRCVAPAHRLAVCSLAITASTVTGQTPQIAELPQVYDFAVTELNLPDQTGQPFLTVVELEGEPVILKLEPYSLRADNFRLLVQGADGTLRQVEPEAPRTYRGIALGFPDSEVRASLIDGQLWAHVTISPIEAWSIQPLSDMTEQFVDASAHVLYRDDQSRPADKSCGVEDVDMLPEIDHDVIEELGGGGVAGTGLRTVELGCDADFEYFQKNASSVSQTMFDIENIMNSVETLYENQLNLTFDITTIVVRTGADPYTSSFCGSLLNQFANAWSTAPESAIRRDLAQLFTGRNLADCLGIAATPSTCTASAYCLVESRAPGLSFAARTALSAHEVGHTLNALHCSTSAPDCVPFGDCRIMCACLGGCGGQITSFAPTAVSQINAYVNAVGCLAPLADPIVPPFFDDFAGATLDPARWSYNDGAFLTSGGTNEPSEPRSMNLDAIGSGTYQDDEVRTNFIQLQGQQGAGIVASFYTQHKGVEAGETLTVEYWSLGQQWEELTTITSDGVDQNEFVFHEFALNNFINVFHNEFRLRFRSDVNQSTDDWYVDDVFVGVPQDPVDPPANDDCVDATVITEGFVPFTNIDATTDGLPLGAECDSLQVESDVWFSYTPTCTGTLTLATCDLTDFDTIIALSFQTGCPPGGSVLACSDDGEGCSNGTSLIQTNVFEGVPYLIRVGGKNDAQGTGQLVVLCAPAEDCPEDLNGDGTVDAADLAALLGSWGGGGSADLDGSGTVDAADLAQLLGAWGPC